MRSFADFLAMGGYGGFVWPAFGITLFVLIGLALASGRVLRRRRAALAALEADALVGGERRR